MNYNIVIKHLTELVRDEIEILKYLNMGGFGSMQKRFCMLLDEQRGWAVVSYDEMGFINGWGLMFEDHYQNHQLNPNQICLYIYVPSGWRRNGIGTAIMNAARYVEPEPFVIPWDEKSERFYNKQSNFKVDCYNPWISKSKKDIVRI